MRFRHIELGREIPKLFRNLTLYRETHLYFQLTSIHVVAGMFICLMSSSVQSNGKAIRVTRCFLARQVSWHPWSSWCCVTQVSWKPLVVKRARNHVSRLADLVGRMWSLVRVARKKLSIKIAIIQENMFAEMKIMYSFQIQRRGGRKVSLRNVISGRKNQNRPHLKWKNTMMRLNVTLSWVRHLRFGKKKQRENPHLESFPRVQVEWLN